MKNRYTGDICCNEQIHHCKELGNGIHIKVNILALNVVTMDDLLFTLCFYSYGTRKSVRVRKDQLVVRNGEYYALLNEKHLSEGWLACDVEILEPCVGWPHNLRPVTIKCITNIPIGGCTEGFPYPCDCEYHDGNGYTNGYNVTFEKVDELPKEESGGSGSYDDTELKNKIENVETNLGNHIKDTKKHITDEERNKWNQGVVSDEERKKWNQGVGGESYTADEEDITLTQNADGTGKVYQFKNRDTSKGMGRIILRSNKTLAEQVTEENTIYEIRYDFDLNGETLEIPEGCVLDFKGGSIKVGESIIKNDVIYGYQVGLVPNSIDYAEFNANKIAKLMNMGFKLIVDNTYYVGASNVVVNRVNIQGLDKNSAKIILTDFVVNEAFVVSKEVDYIGVRNLSIDTTLPKGYLCFNILFGVEEGAPMNLKNVDFNNLNVSGVRLVSFKVPDVDMSSWGIDKFHLSNINANEIDMLVLMTNVPFNYLLIEGVNIKNIHRVGIHAGTDNNYTNQSSIYAKKTIVRNCTIENDFIHTNKSAYLCLLVLEGVECHYYNNIAKNIVCTNNETPTYDSYLTCDILYYHNNSSINVVGLENEGNVDIYKCKNSIGAGGRTLRNISYNSYILEETYFVDNNLQDLEWSVKLGNMQSSINVFEFSHNYVNVEFGVFSFGGFISGFNVAIVTDNIIKAANANANNGASLVHISKNSSIDIINNKFLLGHKTTSDNYPSLLRYKHNMENTNVRIYGNVISNCDMLMNWEPQTYDYDSFIKWLNTWEVTNNSFTYNKSIKNNIYKLHNGSVKCNDTDENPCNLGNIYDIKNCTFYGSFVFGLEGVSEYIADKSDTRQFVGEISIKDYVERFVVRLTYSNGELIKTEYEDAFGRIKEFNNKDYSSMERVYIADYFSLLIYPDKTRIERNFKSEGKVTIRYVNKHTKLSSYFTKMGGALEDMAYQHPLGVPYFCTDKNLPEGYQNKAILWNTGTSKMDSLGRSVTNTAPAPLSGLWADRPSSATSTLKPVVGQGYFCTDKASTEGTIQGIMIYYKGLDSENNDVWVDALGRQIT